jgi:hypothetical protein
MSPEAYEHVLMAANLAQLQPSWYFFIKTRPRMWQQFIDGDLACDRGTFELDSKKLDL